MITYLVFTSKEMKCNQNFPYSALCLAVALPGFWTQRAAQFWWNFALEFYQHSSYPFHLWLYQIIVHVLVFWLHLMLRTPECQCSSHLTQGVICREGGKKAQYFHHWTMEFGWFWFLLGLNSVLGVNLMAQVIVTGEQVSGLCSGGWFGSPNVTKSALEGGDSLSVQQLGVFFIPWTEQSHHTRVFITTGEFYCTQLLFSLQGVLQLLLSGQHFLGIHPICTDL